MYYEKRKKKLLSQYLPKILCVDEVSCTDEKLKQKIITLLNVIDSKINIDKDWTISDYKKFRNKLAKMEVETFETTFDEILVFLNFTKEELENKLMDLDTKTGTNIFGNDRIIISVINPETNTSKQEYKMVPHCFEVDDLVSYLCNLISKINRYNNVVINHYHNKIKSTTDIDEEQQKLNLLIEMLENKEFSIIDIIKKEYLEWANLIYDDEIIGPLIKRMLEQIIRNNVKRLKQEVQRLEIEKKQPYYSYAAQIKYNHMAYKKKEELSRSNKTS